MINITTRPGRTYAVTARYNCIVGVPDMPDYILLELQANTQGYFVAISDMVYITDDTAKVTEVFKLAPQQRLAILGVLGGNVPAWFKALKTELTALLDGSKFELAWLSAESTLVAHTDRVSDELLAAVKATAETAMPEGAVLVQYNHNIEVSWRDINKYAACKNLSDILSINPDYKNDLTSDGAWIYPLTSLVSVYELFRLSKAINHADIYAPKLTSAYRLLNDCYVKTAKIYTPLLRGDGSLMICGSPYLHTCEIVAISEATTSLEYFATDCKVLSEFSMPILPKLSYISNGFSNTQLNKSSILRLLGQLPVWESGNHTGTIGVHVDNKTDEEVLAAIANAEAKGWTLSVQWTGTPTAQASVTYGLRKPPIYARVSEMENGEQYLDWGHYVTDPSGYEEFRSVEAARECYGLPDENLTETE